MPRASQPAKKSSPSKGAKKGSGKKHHKKVSIKGLGRYGHYIQNINKNMKESLRISGATVTVIDQMIHYAIEKIMHSANEVRMSAGKKSISGKQIKSAFDLLRHSSQPEAGINLPHVFIESGVGALKNYNTGKNLKVGGVKVNEGKRVHEICGIYIPVSKVKTEMKLRTAGCGCRVTTQGAIYLAAAINSMVSLLLIEARNAARDNKRKLISTVHLKLALRKHAQFDRFFDKFIFTAGVQPHIHKALLPTAKKASKPKASKPKSKKASKPKNAKKASKPRKARKPTKSSK